MPCDNGYVYAPVSIADVANTLGKNVGDVGALCVQDNINDQSLIRPLYTSSPCLDPNDFENKEHGPSPLAIEEGGSKVEPTQWSYYEKKWGFFVPGSGTPQTLIESEAYLKPWVRNDASLSNSYKCLSHFDGYRHDIRSTLPISANIVAGEEIIVNIDLGSKQKVLNPSGKSHYGGAVAIYEVLGEVHIGCCIYVDGRLDKIYQSPNSIGETLQPKILLQTGLKAVSGSEIEIIPWAVDKGKGYNDKSIISGSTFYGLKFAPDFEGSIYSYVALAFVNMKVEIIKTSNNWTFYVKLYNTYTTPQTVSKFRFVWKDRDNITHTDYLSFSAVVINGSSAGTTVEAEVGSVSYSAEDCKNAQSMIIYADWNKPGEGLKTIQSSELVGVQVNF